MGFARGLLWSGKGLDAGKSRVLAPIGILDLFGWEGGRKRPEEAKGLGRKCRIRGVDT